MTQARPTRGVNLDMATLLTQFWLAEDTGERVSDIHNATLAALVRRGLFYVVNGGTRGFVTVDGIRYLRTLIPNI